MDARVTQKDVAKEAGVSHMTVSLALRSHPSISQETKLRIEEICRRLGYAPDPMLSSLSAYRKRTRPTAYKSNIAWLNAWSTQVYSTWDFAYYQIGATARAKQHGYIIEEIRMADLDYDPRRLGSILRAKGINGILLPPFPHGGAELRLDFSWYSAVRFGFSYKYPQLHTVVNSQFQTALRTVENAIELGYKRIGIILSHDQDARTKYNFLGGFLAGQQKLPASNRIKPFYPREQPKDSYPREEFPDEIGKWVMKSRPDCVIGLGHWETLTQARASHGSAFGQVGYADLGVGTEESILSGMHQSPIQMGANAVDFLNSLIQRGEVGIPDHPVTILTESEWRPGTTLPPLY